jgi:hypothetical protein
VIVFQDSSDDKRGGHREHEEREQPFHRVDTTRDAPTLPGLAGA